MINKKKKKYDINEYLKEQKEKKKNGKIVEITKENIIKKFNEILEMRGL